VLRARATAARTRWTSYEKLRVVIEKKMFSNTEDLLPVISSTPRPAPRSKKHEDFVNRMVSKGYTPKQVRLLCEWYLRVRKSS
jgi:serine protein kinase